LDGRGTFPPKTITGRSGIVITSEPLEAPVPVKDQCALLSLPALGGSKGVDTGKNHPLTPADVRAIREEQLFVYYVAFFTYRDGMTEETRELELWLTYDPVTQFIVFAPFGQRST